MRRCGDDDRVMNACFDAKLLHIIVLIHLSCFISSFTVSGLRAETARGGTDPASAARKTAYFDPQTAVVGRTEVVNGFQNIGVC
jgi:hypothetical protein